MEDILNYNSKPLVVIVSNRGPYSFKQDDDGTFTHQRGAGGLVTALSALAEQLDVLWIASAISNDEIKHGRVSKGIASKRLTV